MRTGDDGTTGLAGGERVPKDAPRVEALGDLDELGAALGLARALDTGGPLDAELAAVQSQLLRVGAELAEPRAEALAHLQRIGEEDVAALERRIALLEAELPAGAGFELPGGSAPGAGLHLARTVCRRTERRVVALRRTEPVEPRLLRYLNRLGDLLFVMARRCDRRRGPAGPRGGRPER